MIESLASRTVMSVLKLDESVLLKLSDRNSISARYWRLWRKGSANLSSFDHMQIYGLGQPVDAFAELKTCLENLTVSKAAMNEMGDIKIEFGVDICFQAFNFSGYEVWELELSDGSTQYSNYFNSRT